MKFESYFPTVEHITIRSLFRPKCLRKVPLCFYGENSTTSRASYGTKRQNFPLQSSQ